MILSILSTLFFFILALGILVFIHELGHFVAAKTFGMRADVFALGFGPRVVGYNGVNGLTLGKLRDGVAEKLGDRTDYRISALPLGGYVKIAGMIDESMDTDELSGPPEPWEYRAKPVWQRMIVITAGVIMNLILAVVIFALLAGIRGKERHPLAAMGGVWVAPGSLAEKMGLRTGDRFTAANGQPLSYYEEITDPELLTSPSLAYTVERDGQPLTLKAPDGILSELTKEEGFFGFLPLQTPIVGDVTGGRAAAKAGIAPGDSIIAIAGTPVRYLQDIKPLVSGHAGQSIPVSWSHDGAVKTATLTVPADSLIGIQLLGGTLPVEYERYGFVGSIKQGFVGTWNVAALTGRFFKKAFAGQEDVRRGLGGPIMIAKSAGKAGAAGAGPFFTLVAWLSVSLAMMNILPIPALDGGHLAFLVYEGIAGREMPLTVKMRLQQAGMALLLLFMGFVIFNDVLNF